MVNGKWCNGGDPLVIMEEMVNVTLAGFAAVTSSREARTINIEREYFDFFNNPSACRNDQIDIHII